MFSNDILHVNFAFHVFNCIYYFVSGVVYPGGGGEFEMMNEIENAPTTLHASINVGDLPVGT